MKKAIAFYLASLLICFSFVGCSSGAEFPASTSIASSSSSSSSASSSSSSSESTSDSASSSSSSSESTSDSSTEKKEIAVSWNSSSDIQCLDIVTHESDSSGTVQTIHHYYLDISYTITNTGNTTAVLSNNNFSAIWDGCSLSSGSLYLNSNLVEFVQLPRTQKMKLEVRFPITASRYEEFYAKRSFSRHRIDLLVSYEGDGWAFAYWTDSIYSKL